MKAHILKQISLDVCRNDFIEHLKQTAGGATIAQQAGPFFDQNQDIWTPGAVLISTDIKKKSKTDITLHQNDPLSSFTLCTGDSTRFLREAQRVICGAYTIGDGLGKVVAETSSRHQYLEGYILEQLSLFLLDQTARKANSIIENMAEEKGWGVGPLLSPGSVHGWPLSDQPSLCLQLPLSKIGMTCNNTGILTPFSSLSFIVGIGPEYTKSTIGSPCEVCSRRESCQIRQTQQT